MSEKGLYNKYTITNNETGEEVQGRYFVLKPDKDPAAVTAILAYADATSDEQLAVDLREWAEGLRYDRTTQADKGGSPCS